MLMRSGRIETLPLHDLVWLRMKQIELECLGRDRAAANAEQPHNQKRHRTSSAWKIDVVQGQHCMDSQVVASRE